jgi:hypothetical protein
VTDLANVAARDTISTAGAESATGLALPTTNATTSMAGAESVNDLE